MTETLAALSDQGFTRLGDEVGEEFRFKSQPLAFHRVEIRRVWRQKLGREVMPAAAFDFVPGSVVEEQVAVLVRVVGRTLGESDPGRFERLHGRSG